MPIIINPTPTVDVSEFVREVMPYVPQAPEFEVLYRIKQAIKQFCTDSRAWRQTKTDLLTTVAGQEDYDADLPDGTDLVAVLSAWDGTTELTTASPGAEDDYQPGTTSGDVMVRAVPVNVVRVIPAPLTAGKVLKGTVCFTPNESATNIPEFIFFRWREVVRDGCLAAMMAQVNKPWSNPGQVEFRMRGFRSGVNRASNEAGPVSRHPLRVKPA